ncbi:hypothetical protein ACQ0QQ_07560 [Lysinibacillus sphaericus]
MNKQTTRAFSAGIMFTAVIIFFYGLYVNEPPSQNGAGVPSGSIIVKKSEIKAKENQISDLKKQLDRYKTGTAKEDAAPGTDKYQLTLSIKAGMTPQDIEEKLKEANIIGEDENFVQYIVDNGYADKIQIGEFLVNSEMTIEEIAKQITN